MKITINSVTYTRINNPIFNSTTDITAQEVPINEYSVDIHTSDDISIGQYAYLYNDDNALWAKYWITDVRKYSQDTVTVYAQSDLVLLSRKKLVAKMYDGEFVGAVIQSIFTNNNLNVSIDSSLNSVELNGYAPQQTARERLQWICFVAGAYIQTDFTDRTKIKDLSAITPKAALNNIVYYKPTLDISDWVTGIRVTAYNYFENPYPARTDEYVKAGGVIYVQSETVYEIPNPETSQMIPEPPENWVEIDGVTLVNYDNVNDILNRLSRYYFKRVNVNADILNNGEFCAGDEIILDNGTGEVVTGYISDTSFSFGHNHKSTLKISQADVSEGVELVIVAEDADNGEEIRRDSYFLPSGYIYSIGNKYIKKTGIFTDIDDNQYYGQILYRPQNTAASGTVGNDTTTNTQEYDAALIKSYKKLKVNIVDGLTEQSGGKVVIA